MILPHLKTDNEKINIAFRIAVGDICSNICSFKDGILKEYSDVMLAGIGYSTPWTRDAAINTWNGADLILPEVSKNTLLSVLKEDNGRVRIGGEYWDAIIWVTGAYNYWLCTGDDKFFEIMRSATINSIQYFEEKEFDEDIGLFCGGACFADGISAYPDIYAKGDCRYISIADNLPKRKNGVGISMHTLSTNCLYYNAYVIAYKITGDDSYKIKAAGLKKAINNNFWNEKTGLYNYIIDKYGVCCSSEGMGQSFAIIFNVADEEKKKSIIKNQPLSKNGIPCLYPNFQRYAPYGTGRHSGTVWPHVQAFWATAAKENLEYDLSALTENAVRDAHFSELYDPESGKRYGGVQEWMGNIIEWKSEKRQMWSATGYLRMILFGILGMELTEEGLYIKPYKIKTVNKLTLNNIIYRDMLLDINVSDWNEAFIAKDRTGHIIVNI